MPNFPKVIVGIVFLPFVGLFLAQVVPESSSVRGNAETKPISRITGLLLILGNYNTVEHG